MYTAIEVAQYVISYCTEKEAPISNLKLQKILYYLQVHYVKKESALFAEDFYAWPYGPVVPEVYYTFSGYGASKIRNRYKSQIDRKTKETIIPIIERLRAITPWELVKMTHAPGGPWDMVFNKGIDSTGVIDKRLLLNDKTDLGI